MHMHLQGLLFQKKTCIIIISYIYIVLFCVLNALYTKGGNSACIMTNTEVMHHLETFMMVSSVLVIRMH